jgi:uncharacterized membrane protein
VRHAVRRIPRHVAIYLCLALVLHPAYALITPPFQTPDEHFHLYRAYQLSRFEVIGERRGDQAGGLVPTAYVRAAGAELDLSRPHIFPRRVPERPLAAIFGRATEVGRDEPMVFTTGAVLYTPAGYVPQVLAVWIGDAAGASVETIIRLGRLLNAALTIALIALALAMMPVGRLPMLVVALLPMTVATAAAFGQDGAVIGASCLLTALGVRASLRGAWRAREFAAAAAAGLIVSLAKYVYVPLLAVALWPIPRGVGWSRWSSRVVALLAPTLALVALWLLAVRGLMVPAGPDLPSWSEQLHFMLAEPARSAAAVLRGWVGDRYRFEQIVGTFGWLNVGPSKYALVLVPLATLAALLAGDDGARSLGWQRRAWYLVVAAGVALGMALILLLVYSPLGAREPQGLQGRYYLPLLPLALVALLPARRRLLPTAYRVDLLVAGLMLAANVASLLTIARAFYSR